LFFEAKAKAKPAGRGPPAALFFVQAATKSRQKGPFAGGAQGVAVGGAGNRSRCMTAGPLLKGLAFRF